MLTKETILTADDLPRVKVVVPEWGGLEVYVRTMTGAERDRWEIETVPARQKAKDHTNIRAMIAALTLCDEHGNLLFTQDDVEALGRKSAAALDRVVEAASKLNRFTDKDVEELEKNS